MPIDLDQHKDHRRSEHRASIGGRRMRVSDERRHAHDAGSRRRTPGDTARASSPIPPVARRGDNPPTGPRSCAVRHPRTCRCSRSTTHARATTRLPCCTRPRSTPADARSMPALAGCSRRPGPPTTSTIACASRWTASRCLERPRACSRVRVRIRRPRSRSPNSSPRAARSRSSGMVKMTRRLAHAASAPGPAARCGRRWRVRACAARLAEACVSRGDARPLRARPAPSRRGRRWPGPGALTPARRDRGARAPRATR